MPSFVCSKMMKRSCFYVCIVAIPVLAAPTGAPTSEVISVSQELGRAFLWSSIGLAVLTALIQGLVAALAFMTESSNFWTFRFRLAKIEHWWWSLVSLLLLTSLVLIILSFLTGSNGESVSILALSTATFLTIVQYALPAWRSRRFIHNRWLAWTGDSRTGIPKEKASFCGDASKWAAMVKEVDMKDVKKTPSDWYGLRLWPVGGLPQDPTDILRNANASFSRMLADNEPDRNISIYDDGNSTATAVSLLWGPREGFRKRVSRATASMPSGLLHSRPFTVDGYAGEGLCLAMGILGRNKGLNPKQLVFKMNRDISTFMENYSTWAPRPYKVLRSYYAATLEKQFAGLGPDFVAAAVELALLLMDVRDQAIAAWLEEGMEHQSLYINKEIAKYSTNKKAELKAHYESSYVSMIISLNNMDRRMKYRSASNKLLLRPDLICACLLLKARGEPEPHWWSQTHLVDVRKNQMAALSSESDWKQPMAKLLGLEDGWPPEFDYDPPRWSAASEKSQIIRKGELEQLGRLHTYRSSSETSSSTAGHDSRAPAGMTSTARGFPSFSPPLSESSTFPVPSRNGTLPVVDEYFPDRLPNPP